MSTATIRLSQEQVRELADYQEYIDKRNDVSPKEGKKRYGDVVFADAKNKKYPIDTEPHIRAAWSYINQADNGSKYGAEDLAVVKGHIIAAWKSKIDKAGPPAAQKDNDQIDMEYELIAEADLTEEEKEFAKEKEWDDNKTVHEGSWGLWRTVMGRKIFIRDGEGVREAFKRSQTPREVTAAARREDHQKVANTSEFKKLEKSMEKESFSSKKEAGGWLRSKGFKSIGEGELQKEIRPGMFVLATVRSLNLLGGGSVNMGYGIEFRGATKNWKDRYNNNNEMTQEQFMEYAEEEGGKWVTMGGRRVFIKAGETGTDALKRSLGYKPGHETFTGTKAADKYIPLKGLSMEQLKPGLSSHIEALNARQDMKAALVAKGWKYDKGQGNRSQYLKGGKTAVIDSHQTSDGKWSTAMFVTPNYKKNTEQEERSHAMMTREQMLAKCKKEHPNWTPAQHAAAADKMMKEQVSAMSEDQLVEYSNAIRGVEIFSTGTHNGDEYTEADLDDIVTAFKELDYRPAIKVGHTKDNADKTATPSYGWVRNLRKVGTKLVADFEDMHDSVVDALRKRQYDRVSSEIYFNLHRAAADGVQKVYRRALKAVALLGAEVPAVSNLVPLHKMEFAADEDAFDDLATCELQMEVPTQALIDSLAERVSGLVTLIKEYDMAKNTEQIKALKAQVAEFQTKMDAMKKKKGMMDDMDDDDAAKLSEDLKALEAQFTAATESIKRLEAEDTNASDVATLQKQLADAQEREKVHKEETKALSARMAKIEHEKRLAEIGARVKSCKVPAFRESLESVYAYALEHADATVKVYAVKDGKTEESTKTLAEVVDNLVGQINSQSEKLFTALAKSGQPVREDGTAEEDASLEVDAKAKEYMQKNVSVKSYTEAVGAVLKADKDLAQRYREQLGAGQ